MNQWTCRLFTTTHCHQGHFGSIPGHFV